MKKVFYILVIVLLLAGCGKQEMSAEELKAAKKELFSASEASDIDKVKELLAAGVGVNAKDKYGLTALHQAAVRGRIEMAKLLIESGADVNVPDSQGRTPLDKAKSEEMKALLRAHGAVSGAELKSRKEE